MGNSVVLRAEGIGGGWTGGPVTTLETVEHIEKDGCGGRLALPTDYLCGRTVKGTASRTLCSSLKRQRVVSARVLQAWYMKAEDASGPRAARRLSTSLFQSPSDWLRFF